MGQVIHIAGTKKLYAYCYEILSDKHIWIEGVEVQFVMCLECYSFKCRLILKAKHQYVDIEKNNVKI